MTERLEKAFEMVDLFIVIVSVDKIIESSPPPPTEPSPPLLSFPRGLAAWPPRPLPTLMVELTFPGGLPAPSPLIPRFTFPRWPS